MFPKIGLSCSTFIWQNGVPSCNWDTVETSKGGAWHMLWRRSGAWYGGFVFINSKAGSKSLTANLPWFTRIFHWIWMWWLFLYVMVSPCSCSGWLIEEKGLWFKWPLPPHLTPSARSASDYSFAHLRDGISSSRFELVIYPQFRFFLPSLL